MTVKTMSDTTLDYYNQNASEFIDNTVNASFEEMQDLFLSYVKPNGLILDLGCGSGRDTKYFIEKGYSVEAVDGSYELCMRASGYTGIHVKQMLFLDLDEHDRYDGIWACASILHLKKKELPLMFRKMSDALKERGILYASFKYGEFEGYRNGRYFTDLNEHSLNQIIDAVEGFAVLRQWITTDVREGRKDQKWINIILEKNTH